MNDQIARIKTQHRSLRRVIFHHAPNVEREISFRRLRTRARYTKKTWNHAEMDKARPRLTENAEILFSSAGLNAENADSLTAELS